MTLRKISQLQEAGLLSPAANSKQLAELVEVEKRYSVAVSDAVIECIDREPATAAGVADDPVARQFIPAVEELVGTPQDLVDPIGDEAHSPMRGLVHRYEDRVLLKATEVCPVYCRFCFRRESVGGNAKRPLTDAQWGAIFDYIETHGEIWEVIVSGGDPLVLSDERLRVLLDGLGRAPHVKVVRFHSRVPVVKPDRVTPQLVELLAGAAQTVYVAVHANHANEFSAAAKQALARLADRGVILVSQSVLLAGVNDSVAALSDLMRAFVESRITPYYLHQLDLAPGTDHFRVPIEQGQALLEELRGTFSGLCQPRYVIDLPGGYGKVPIDPVYLDAKDDNTVITDPAGRAHAYPPERSKKGETDYE